MNNHEPGESAAPTKSDILPEGPVGFEHRGHLDFPVIGIGASAGGVEALSLFFRTAPARSGMAFVAIQHLPPDSQSLMVEILSRCTPMRVLQIEDGMRLEPDTVYVIRPGFTVTLSAGVLHLGEPVEKRGHRRPIDDFFRSLALEQKERAIIVILSGTGTNGTAGAQAIKAAGGLCVAQDPDTAEFPGMPRSLVHSGYADQVLPAEAIPGFLMSYVLNPLIRRPASEEVMSAGQDESQGERPALGEIHALLRIRTGHDFRGYRKPTLLRRIQRRMGVVGVTRISEYTQRLRDLTDEATALANDLMINVTGFFRDLEAWEALREGAIAALVENQPPGESLRAWVTACASGEEAYSLAMLIAEECERTGKSPEVKIFATDTADKSLMLARAGIYPAGIEGDITPSRLERFFDKDEYTYKVKKEIRNMVVFAPQNLLRDPPFSRVDICTCRNLLIYLEPETQKRVLSLLSFSVRDGGFLFLGNTENLGDAERGFETVSKRWRIFRRIGPTQHRFIDLPYPPKLALRNTLDPPASARVLVAPQAAQISYERALLEEFAPPSVIVDGQERMLYFHGDTAPFLAYPPGELTNSLIEVTRPALRAAVRSALRQALETQVPSTVHAQLDDDDSSLLVRVTAAPLKGRSAGRNLRVSFELRPQSAAATPDENTVEAQGAVEPPPYVVQADSRLEDEVRILRRELQASVEAFEASNEELKASNEEVLSVNEELQSANEELETSKEELQSINEELTTVNTQLQAKILEFEYITNDLTNLLSSTNIAVVFLDTQLRVRRFTPAVQDLLELIPTDIGRSISDLAPKFSSAEENETAHGMLRNTARVVLDTLSPVEKEVSSHSGRWYLHRTLPYRTADNRIEGVVLTFVDITALKAAERALRDSEQRLRLIVENAHDFAILSLDLEGRVTAWSTGAQSMFGWTEAEVIGRSDAVIFSQDDRDAAVPQRELQTALQSGRADDERWHIRKDGTPVWANGVLSAARDDSGTVRGFVKIMRDNTDWKETEDRLYAATLSAADAQASAEAANRAKDDFISMISHELRTPLNTMRLWLRLMGHESLPEKTRTDGWRMLERAVCAQQQLIDDLLDVSRISSGKLRLDVRPMRLEETIEAAIEAVRPVAARKGVELNYQARAQFGVVRADPDRLQQIVWNLLSNAVKFTPSGGNVLIELDNRDGDFVVVRVTDTGMGIRKDLLPHIFDRFRQGESGATRQHGGLGLGLAIARQLIELHGGTILASSDGEGRGACFEVRLPLKADVEDPTTLTDSRELRTVDLTGIHVLLVEDEESAREGIRALLETNSAHVRFAESASGARDTYRLQRPDILVSDIGLPGEDGYTLIQNIRSFEQQHGDPRVPALALTAFARDEDRRRAIEAGFDAHLAKPVDPDKLLVEVGRLTGRLILR